MKSFSSIEPSWTNNEETKKKKKFQDIKATDYDYGVDDNYINTFLEDSKNFILSSQDDYKNINYKTAESMYEAKKNKKADLGFRANTIKAFLNANKDNIDSSYSEGLTKYLDSFNRESNNISKFYRKAFDSFNSDEAKQTEFENTLNNARAPFENKQAIKNENDAAELATQMLNHAADSSVAIERLQNKKAGAERRNKDTTVYDLALKKLRGYANSGIEAYNSSVEDLQKQVDKPVTTMNDLDLTDENAVSRYLGNDREAVQFVTDYRKGKLAHSADNEQRFQNLVNTIEINLNTENEINSRYGNGKKIAYTDESGSKVNYGDLMRNKVAQNRISDITASSDQAKETLAQISKGGNRNILDSSPVDSNDLKNAGWSVSDGAKTNFTKAYSSEQHDTAAVFSPVVLNEDGSVKQILSPDELESYAEDILSGKGDKLNLRVSDIYYGAFAASLANENSNRISRLSERYYNDTDLKNLVDIASVEDNDSWKEAREKLSDYGVDWDEYKTYDKLIENKEESQKASKEYADWSTENFGTGTLATIANIATSPFQAFEYVQNLGENLVGYLKAGTNELSANLLPNIYNDTATNLSSASSQAISSSIKSSIKGNGDNEFLNKIGELAAQTYGGITSAVQSALTILTCNAFLPPGVAQAVGLSVLSGEAANGAYHDVIDNGGTVGQAITYSAAAGVNEALGEQLSIESLLNIKETLGKEKAKTLLINALKQSLAEGQEEVLTEGLNEFADRLINGDKSQYDRSVQQYMEQGFSEKEAKKKASLDFIVRLEWAAYGGAVGGGFSGGGKVLYNTAKLNLEDIAVGSQLNSKSNVNRLVDTALQMDNDIENATDLKALAQKIVDNNYKASNRQIGKLQRMVQDVNLSEIKGSGETIARQTIKAELQSQGVSENDIEKATNAIYKKEFSGESLTYAEEKAIKTKAAQAAIQNVRNQSEDIATKAQTRQERYLKNFAETQSLTQKEANPTVDIEDLDISDDGKTYIKDTNEAVDIKNIAKISKDDIVVTLSSGKTESVKNLDLGNEDTAIAYQSILDMAKDSGIEITPSVANAIVNLQNASGIDNAAVYYKAATEVLENGWIGNTKYSLNTFAVELPENVRNEIYSLGRQLRQTYATNKTEALKNKKAPVKMGLTQLEGIPLRKLNVMQQSGVKVMQQFSKTTGLNITFFKSSKIDGKFVSRYGTANGFFDTDTNTIYIDVNAGLKGQGFILYTAAHELTHFIREWSPEHFKTFADFLVSEYNKNNVSVDELVREKQRTLRKELTYDQAYEEVIADSCESFLKDTDLIEKSAKLKNQDSTLWEKIKTYLSDLLDKVRALYSRFTPDSNEGKHVLTMKDSIQKIHEMWVNGALSAIESYNKAEKGNITGDKVKSTGIKLQERLENYPYNMQTVIQEYLDSVDNEVLEFAESVEKGNYTNKRLTVGNVDSREIKDIKNLLDIDIAGFKHTINTSGMEHIIERHGKNGKKDMSMKNNNDIARIKYIIKKYDKVEILTDQNGKQRFSKAFMSSDNTPAPMIRYSKKINGTYYVVESVPDSQYKRLWIQSAYIEKNTVTQASDENTPDTTSETNLASPVFSTNIISQTSENINPQNKKSSERYSYDELISKPDMKVTTINDKLLYKSTPTVRKNIVNQAVKNAAAVGYTNSNGNAVVHVDDIDTDVIVSKHGLQHGLDRRLELLTPVTLKAGEILKNAIRINELTPEKQSINESYVLIGMARNYKGTPYLVSFVVNRATNELSSVDVLYAINTKKEPAGLIDPDVPAKADYPTGSTISISRLLDYVNRYFPDLLPESVLKHYNYDARPNGKLGESALYSERIEYDYGDLFESEDAELLAGHIAEELSGNDEGVATILKRQSDVEISDAKALKLAQKIVKQFGMSSSSASEITDTLLDVLDKAKDNTLTGSQTSKLINVIADEMSKGFYVDENVKSIYKDVVNTYKGAIQLNEEQQRHIEEEGYTLSSINKELPYGMYFKKAQNGAKETVTSIFEDMSTEYPQYFSEDVYNNNSYSAATELVQALKQMKEDSTALMGDTVSKEDIHEQATLAAAEMYADVVEAKQNVKSNQAISNIKKTLRESQRRKIKEAKAKAVDQKRKELLRQRERFNEKEKNIREEYREQRQRTTERRTRTEFRHQIRKLTDTFKQRLVKPSENKYVPRQLIAQTVDVLNAIDLDTGRSEAMTQQFALLRSQYDMLKDDAVSGAIYDETVSTMLRDLTTTIGDTPFMDMSTTQLKSIYNTLKALDTVIRNSVKMVNTDFKINAYQIGEKLIMETRAVPKTKGSLFSTWVQAGLRPQAMFNRLAGFVKNSYWSQLGEMLNNGQLRQTQLEMEFNQIFDKLVSDTKNLKTIFDTKNLIDIGLVNTEGEPVLITRGMMISLYMSLLDKDGARHVSGGGLTVPDMKLYYKGDYKLAYAKGFKSVNMQINEASDYILGLRGKIEEHLNDYDKQWIKAARYFFDVASKNALNDTTMQLYGFKKATIENYYPIHTDPDYRAAAWENIVRNMSLENVGIMKDRVKASNPILLEDITDVINNQISIVSKYCGLTIPIKNFQKAYGTTMIGFETSVQKELNKKFPSGKNSNGAIKYIDDLITDLTSGRQGKDSFLAKKLNQVRGNLAKATLTFNLRVAISQAASYPTAAAEIGWNPLFKALAKGGEKSRVFSKAEKDIIAQISPLLWKRTQGYANVELGDLRNDKAAKHKIQTKFKQAMSWIEFFDSMTVGRLFYACQYYVEDTLHLARGTEEYNKALAKTYNDVIEKTQPNYTIMQRPEILRNPHAVVKSLTMFMTQRLQNFNIVYDAVGTYAKYRNDFKLGKNDVALKDVKEAGTRLRRAVTSQIAAATTIATMKFISNTLLRMLDAYRDDDKELTAESISWALLDSFADSIISNILFGSELYALFKAIAFKEKYHGITENAVSLLNDAIKNIVSLTQNGVSLDNLNYLAKSVCQVLGIPLNNVEKIALAIYNHINDATNGEFGSFESGVNRTNKQELNRAQKAYESGDTEKANKIFKDLYQAKLEDGKSQKDAKKAIRAMLTAKYKKEYTQAYLDHDTKTMNETRRYLYSTNMYDDLNALDKILNGWKKDANK